MRGQGFSVRSNGIFGFIFMILVLVGLFFIARGIFKLLALAAPVLILGALIINYRTVINYFKFILNLFKRSVLTGIIAVLLSIIGFPILSAVLFGKSILDRKVKRLQQHAQMEREGELVEYEEVIKPTREKDLELPPLEKQEPPQKENPYKDLF